VTANGHRAGSFLASFDIEDWFHAENVRSSLPVVEWSSLEPRVERNVHQVLDILAEGGARSTFFVLGWIARRYPGLITRIVAEGHEVASHTDRHRRLDSMAPVDLIRDLSESRDSLEQLAGTRVWGIRAPNFSISDEVLACFAESGYWYDSSVYAFKAHDRYGKIAVPLDTEQPVLRLDTGLLELPMTRVTIGPLALPWSGGGYFRLIPYPVFRWGVSKRLKDRSAFMFYLHPWELDPEEVPPQAMPPLIRFRSYVGRGRMPRDLRRLLQRFGSSRIDDTLRAWGYAPPG
jgi:polysaccharide deacetylase family protein (PEP-CTERM system associated)